MNSSPSFVSVTPFLVRLKITIPSSFSSSCTAPVRDGCAIYKTSDALLNEPISEMAIT